MMDQECRLDGTAENRPESPASSRLLRRCSQSASPATQVSRAPIRSRSGSKDTRGDWPEQSRTRVQRACPPSSPPSSGWRQGSCSPRGICTDHVQNSIRDRRRLVASNFSVTKASPSPSCADSAETGRKRRQMSTGELCPYA